MTAAKSASAQPALASNQLHVVRVAPYRTYVSMVLLSSVLVWGIGVYASRTHLQSLIIFAGASCCAVPTHWALGAFRGVPLFPRPDPRYRYRYTSVRRFVTAALWPEALSLAGILIAQGAHADVAALVEGVFLGPAITMARELRRIQPMEQRYGGRVFIELPGFNRRNTERRTSRLWVLPRAFADTR